MADVVIDASVVVAAVSPSEPGYPEALEFLKRAHSTHAILHEPPQFLLELYAVLSRRPRELRQLGFMTEDDPLVVRWAPLGEAEIQNLLAWLTSNCPGKCPTRGADLAYVSTALRSPLPLVTLDSGLLSFRSCGVDVYAPQDFIARLEIYATPNSRLQATAARFARCGA
jgi:predicted nucleic acid-binding protein